MKFKHPLAKGEVKELRPNVFGVSIENNYDRAMLFCRYQEFYESPIKKLKGKFFTLETLMKEYVNQRGENTFTYATDWAGYNIPSHILWKAYDLFYKSKTQYDEIMSNILYHCDNYPLQFNKQRSKWYLISANSFDGHIMNHEIAHGLYYTNKQYKKNCDILISKIKKKDYNLMKKKLLEIGYSNDKKIIDDEIQAFMSTGLYNKFSGEQLEKYEQSFIDNFKNF
jgi:hypothetical protein